MIGASFERSIEYQLKCALNEPNLCSLDRQGHTLAASESTQGGAAGRNDDNILTHANTLLNWCSLDGKNVFASIQQRVKGRTTTTSLDSSPSARQPLPVCGSRA